MASLKPMKPTTTRPDCGTLKGYRRHAAYGEFPCNGCLDANTGNVAANKILRGQQDRVRADVVTLGLALLRLQELDPEYYESLRARMHPEVADACMTRAKNDL